MKDKLLNEGIPKYFEPHPPITTMSKDPQDKLPKSQDNVEKHCHPKDQGEVETKQTHSKSQNTVKKKCSTANRVENLTHRAADLSISATDPVKVQRPPTLPLHIGKEEAEVRRSPRLRAKRVRSVM